MHVCECWYGAYILYSSGFATLVTPKTQRDEPLLVFQLLHICARTLPILSALLHQARETT